MLLLNGLATLHLKHVVNDSDLSDRLPALRWHLYPCSMDN